MENEINEVEMRRRKNNNNNNNKKEPKRKKNGENITKQTNKDCTLESL